jgi:alginate O-acetyltransferase complex protein AlgI
VKEAFVYYRAMFGMGEAGFAAGGDLYYLGSYALMLVIAGVACTPLGRNAYAKLSVKARSIAAPVLVMLVLILSTAYLVDATYNPFLYFRF